VNRKSQHRAVAAPLPPHVLVERGAERAHARPVEVDARGVWLRLYGDPERFPRRGVGPRGYRLTADAVAALWPTAATVTP
jgi:hypothetical protein